MSDTEGVIPGRAVADAEFYAALIEDDAQELYENAPCAYLSATMDGTIVKVNHTMVSWTGHRREELIGRRLQDLLAPGDRIFYETHVAPLLRMQDRARELAVELVARSGARLPVIINAAVIRDSAGEPAVIRAALFDATERRAYEQELLAARRRAEESEARAVALAQTLQATFLPPALITLPGIDLGGSYRPAGDGTEVGGDFYDVFETGRDDWGIVLGDVCGKGASAAALTSLARYTVRAAASRSAAPGAVLGELHDAFVRFHPDQFCTVLLAFLSTPDAAGFRLTLASGGHHLPICRRANGSFESLGASGTIIGMLDEVAFEERNATLRQGDVLALFTDGVVEAGWGTEFFGEAGVRAVMDATADLPAQAISDRLVSAALDYQDGDARDDIAVVVLKPSIGD